MEDSAIRIADRLISFANTESAVQIFPHVRVDGDSLGSAAAMALVLRRLNIRSSVVMDEPIPERLTFLEIPEDLVIIYDPKRKNEYCKSQGIALAVDCSEGSRMGKSGQLYDCCSEPLVIDHHISSGESKGFRYIDPLAAAAAELVLRIIHILEDKTGKKLLDPLSSNCLMVGLQSDTGRFSYQNTTPETFRAASELLENGANVYINAYNLFDLTNVERMRLIARAMSEAQFFFGGRLALTVVTQDMIRDCRATDDASDGLASNLRDIKGVVASFAVRETPDGEIRVNIRSYQPFDSAAFASSFGGGGHQRAAGFTVTGKQADEVCALILEKAGEVLSDRS